MANFIEFIKKYSGFLVVSGILVVLGTCMILRYADTKDSIPDTVLKGTAGETKPEKAEQEETEPEEIKVEEKESEKIETVESSEESVDTESAEDLTKEAEEENTEVISEAILEVTVEASDVAEQPAEMQTSETTIESENPEGMDEEIISDSKQTDDTPLEVEGSEQSEPTEESELVDDVTAEPSEEAVNTSTPGTEEIKENCTHSWILESYYQEPTCGNGGLENQVCAVCGATQTTNGTPTGKHNYVVETPGDCCSEEMVRCDDCNHREVRGKDKENHIDVEDGFCYGCGQKVDN